VESLTHSQQAALLWLSNILLRGLPQFACISVFHHAFGQVGSTGGQHFAGGGCHRIIPADLQCILTTDALGLQAEHAEEEPQAGIDWPLVVRTAARSGQQLGACRLARFAWTKLRTMPFPPDWRVCSTSTDSSQIPTWHSRRRVLHLSCFLYVLCLSCSIVRSSSRMFMHCSTAGQCSRTWMWRR
jgi:hypothetical protein